MNLVSYEGTVIHCLTDLLPVRQSAHTITTNFHCHGPKPGDKQCMKK